MRHHQDLSWPPATALPWTPSASANRRSPGLAPGALAQANMGGAGGGAAGAAPAGVPLVASEHNQMSWPGDDHTEEARTAERRVDRMLGHGPSVRELETGLGVGD